MTISVLRLLGERVAHKTLAKNSHKGGFLDIKLGFSMLKDRRVSFGPKLMALGLGAGLIALLIALEFPLESLLAIVVPGLGLVLDFVTDGLEALLGTVGVAALLLPHLAPKLLTQQFRNERAGIIEEPLAAIPSMPSMIEPARSTYDLPQPEPRVIYPR